ncbi:MAG: hypothetical protein SO253_04570 [Bacilli bacterium]|nr:hypothetical protein [Bacilli bacterium]
MRKKEGILCFLDVMIKYSDENHPLSVAKIMELLKEKHHIDVAKQTVYNYFEVLEAMNIEVVKGDKGRYLLSRTLEKEEAFLLCHSIIANNTIEEKYSQDMIQKIIGTQSTYFDSSFIHYIYNVDKKDNKDLFLNISLIGECIKTKCKISFNYTTYNFKKEIINKREKNIMLFHYVLWLATIVTTF